jgi:TonB family protein
MAEFWKQWDGQVVDGVYPLRQYLGGSGHSAVFLTEYDEPQGRRRAAIKLVAADPQGAGLQLARWQLAAKLSHPHLIRIFRVGHCQLSGRTLAYLVMEYAEENLSQVLPNRPLTAGEAREVLEPTLRTLTYVHGQGFVHGHLKPANIMAIDDQPKLSSDGLCEVGEPGAGASPSVYDPPEIVAGGSFSPASDVWSLGVTLTEALTQHLPVWSGTEGQEPVLPETLANPFLEIVRHCLRPDPLNRWTVADIVANLPQTVPPQTSPKRSYIVLAAALGLSLLVLIGGFKLLNRRTEAGPGEQKVSPEAKQTAASQSPTPSRSKRQREASGSELGPAGVVHQVLPDVPQKARDTIRGAVKVMVRVRVDSSGNVVDAKLDSPASSKYFADLAMSAARRWRFSIVEAADREVSREWILRFEFGRTETRVRPVRVAPP